MHTWNQDGRRYDAALETDGRLTVSVEGRAVLTISPARIEMLLGPICAERLTAPEGGRAAGDAA